jgi:hypothetical protein
MLDRSELQQAQAANPLSRATFPPADFGMMWSNVKCRAVTAGWDFRIVYRSGRSLNSDCQWKSPPHRNMRKPQ